MGLAEDKTLCVEISKLPATSSINAPCSISTHLMKIWLNTCASFILNQFTGTHFPLTQCLQKKNLLDVLWVVEWILFCSHVSVVQIAYLLQELFANLLLELWQQVQLKDKYIYKDWESCLRIIFSIFSSKFDANVFIKELLL